MDGLNEQYQSHPVRGIILYSALLGSLATGAYTFQTGQVVYDQTQDRYTGADAKRDFALRDSEISHLDEKQQDIRRLIQKLDDNHPPRELIAQLVALTNRVRSLERQVDRAHPND